MGLILRVALVIAYFFLGLSCLMFAGMTFGAAFLSTFTVENGLERPVWISPVGTVGPDGWRSPLPVSHRFVVAIPVAVRGGYELQPNETRSITYDMDDINFSEIVVEDANGMIGQLIVNPDPTASQYRAPTTKHFLLKADSLVPVPAAVSNAARRAQQPSNLPIVFVSILVLPWPSVLLLSWLSKKHGAKLDSKLVSRNAEVNRNGSSDEF